MKKKILFTILNLGQGGAEKVFTTLVENLNNDFEISVVVFFNSGYYEERIRQLKNVNLFVINTKIPNTLAYALSFRKLIKQIRPDKIISFLWYPNIISYLANINLNIPHIPTEHSIHRIYLTNSIKGQIWRFLLKKTYKNANKIIPVSKQMKLIICEDFSIHKEKVMSIYNGIDFKKIKLLAKESITDFQFIPSCKYIIAVGRLCEPKNYHLLLKSFSHITKEDPNIHLIILGDGELKIQLTKQALNLGITETTHFLGFKSNPFKYLAKSDVYVLSSKWESFSLSLIEAMFANGHVVSTNCPTGPPEIITHNEDGLLVENNNEVELTKGLKQMLFNIELRDTVFINSKEKALSFDYQIMLKKYKSVLDE